MDRARQWELRTRRLDLGRWPLLMGILNVTPDSFSDGGQFRDTDRAVERGLEMVAQGADILDIGGESTRPYSAPVRVAEEIARVRPVLERLARRTSVPLSIDTSKAEVARVALDCGAEILNDVSGFRHPELLQLAVESQAGVCVMHMQGTPQTMQDNPQYDDVVNDIKSYLALRRDALQERGISASRICLDPGVGFGKTHAHNLELVARAGEFLELGCPLLVGHSRKGFIGKLLGDPELDRTFGTLGVSLALAEQAVHVLRVHDVGPTRQALKLFSAARSAQSTRSDRTD